MKVNTNVGISGLTFSPSLAVTEMARVSQMQVERLHLDGDVPEWTDAEMERLYHSIFSSSVLLRASALTHEVSTYVKKVAGEATSVVLYQTENGRVIVLNELIPLPPGEIRDFVDYIFTKMPTTRSITFKAIKTEALELPYPYQRYNHTEDIIIDLPATPRLYHDSLGKNVRKTIRQYSSRIERDFPTFEYVVVHGRDVQKEHILRIVELNRARMSVKNKVSGVDDAEIQWLSDCIRHFDGMAVLAMVDGKVCAGQLCCHAGSDYFMLIVGHDSAWDSYRLGTLCQFRAICEVIERGGKACHFLWGREEYKYRFLGVRHDFDKIVVYSSYAGMIREARQAASLLARAKMRQARIWLLDPANQDKTLPKIANRLRHARSKA